MNKLGDSTLVSILHKSTAHRYRPVRVADGPITARCRFINNASSGTGIFRFQVFLNNYSCIQAIPYVFEFYGPVSTVKHVLSRSVNIHVFLGRISPKWLTSTFAHTVISN